MPSAAFFRAMLNAPVWLYRFRRSCISPLLLFLFASAASAGKLTPERAFADPNLSGPGVRSIQLSPDGKLVTFLKAKVDNQLVLDLWAAPVHGGVPTRLVDAAAFNHTGAAPSEVEKARRERQRIFVGGIVEYVWDNQGNRILVPAAGDLYLVDPGTRKLRRLTKTSGDETDGRFSPRGRFVSYIRDQNLYLQDLVSNRERALTRDGKGAVSYGTAEFVAQEEMARFTGYWWSPDDRHIAYTRVDDSKVAEISRLDIGASGATVVEQRYPRAGQANASVELYVTNLSDRPPTKVDLGPSQDIYIARVGWSTDGKTLLVERENRAQTELDLLAVDPASGAAKVIVAERQKPWVDITDNLTPLDDGTFLWGSQRSGFNHLYLFSRQGELIRQVTHGKWPVVGVNTGTGRPLAGVVHVDQTRRLVYFLSGKDTALEQHLYVTSYDKPAEPRRITTGHGWWTATGVPNGRVFIGSYSDPSTPPQSAIYTLDGQRLRWIEQNPLWPGHPYYPFLDQHVVPEFGTLHAADGTPLSYTLMKPKDFDSKRRYPVIIEVYGGPGVQDVRRNWRPLSEQLLLGKGYILFQLANRGGFGRGFDFARTIAGHLGTVEVEDQRVGINWLKSQPFVDPARIGVTGWSYGGYMTLRLLTEPGIGIRAGAAGAPPTDWKLYDTHYTERFMGTPQARPEAYAQSSILPRLGNLQGRLLLMQGMADDNVGFTNSTAVMDVLQGLSVPFDLMLYPGQRHLIVTAPRQLQQMRTYIEFFDRELASR